MTPESDFEWPPGFSLDQERILTLLTGDRFYSNASAALREAILNAIDATHRRQVEEPAHRPSIEVEFNQSDLSLTISDNGDGMGKRQIAGLFTKIGASAAETDPRGSGAVGEFGIGVVSYFMAADSFEVETCDGTDAPIGLGFRKEMFAGGEAESFEAARGERGTTLTLRIRDRATFELLLEKFPHWCRGVEGLSAIELPGSSELAQGSNPLEAGESISVELRDGIEDARLGPISDPGAWDAMTGSSEVSILYRGVFVQNHTANGVWGVRGSIDVDPKYFKPKLNREGFVGAELGAEVDAFLRSVHPAVLLRMSDLLRKAFEGDKLSKWDERRWATLWLSVPRGEAYAEAAERWDAVFRRVPAFERWQGKKWVGASLEELLILGGPLWVAPGAHENPSEVIKSAERLLRETGRPVVRGLSRETSWLKGAANAFATTADLIRVVFAEELPELRSISQEASSILEEHEALHVLYGGEETVELVALGAEGAPILRVGKRLLINRDVEEGVRIATYVLDRNRGRHTLIEATAAYAQSYLQSVASIARTSPDEDPEVLGLVKRRIIRELLS